MGLYGQKQLADGMRTVRKNTITIAEDIPEAQYDFRPAPDSRSVRETLLHIASKMLFDLQIHEEEKRSSLEGLDLSSFFKSLPTYEKLPLSKNEILNLLDAGGERWSSWVENLPEERLTEIVTRGGAGPGGGSRFEMLIGTKEHEMHHRAQLMVTERLLGIVPHLTRNRQQPPGRPEKAIA